MACVGCNVCWVGKGGVNWVGLKLVCVLGGGCVSRAQTDGLRLMLKRLFHSFNLLKLA